MRDYITRRTLLIIPTIFIVTLAVFFTVRLVPGDIVDLMVSDMKQLTSGGKALTANDIRARLGLDQPVHIQYTRWLGGIVQGDLGTSLWTKRPMLESLANRIPISFELGLISIVTGILIAVPIGTYSAMRQDTLGDYLGRTVAIVAMCVPGFWIATMVMVYPSIWWNWMPSVHYVAFLDDPLKNLGQFLLPGFIMGLAMSGATMRMVRTTVLEIVRQDYIRTARAKGLGELTVVTRHIMKNALIPVVTLIAYQIPLLIGGTVVIEQIFSLPGVGLYFIEALNKRDYPIISGVNLVLCVVVLFNNLVIDLSYAYLDPRIRYR